MCEFCTEHGEGKTWYLQMENYAHILLHEELSASQREISQYTTRLEWLDGFLERFVMPAMGNVPRTQGESPEVQPASHPPEVQPSAEEILARRKVDHFGQVLPIEDVEAVLDSVDSITRMPCGCRYMTTGKTDKRYCFGLGIDRLGLLGKYPDAAASLEVLDREQAKAIFRRYDEEGLMHSIWTAVTPYVAGICNCDRDCGAYKGSIEMRGPPSFFRAEYLCRSDWDLCTGCKSCMSQCQFGAMFYSSALSKVYIDPSRCYGCGVCRAACPNDAITLMARHERPEVADVWL